MSHHKVDHISKIEALCEGVLSRFRGLLLTSFVIHLLAILLIIACVLFSLYALLSHPYSLLFAISIASIVLSSFSYVLLKLYFQAQKPEQFQNIKARFVAECETQLPKILAPQEQSLSLANASFKLSSQLLNYEYSFVPPIESLPSLSRLTRKISSFFFFRDVLTLREIFLMMSIEKHIEIVKKYPTDLEIHASLAHAYLALSRLYQDYLSRFGLDSEGYAVLKTKFSQAVHTAIEEFTIIDHYAPNDPWVHAQLASSYHALEEFEKELAEYERILELCPNDKEIMHRLGILYFKLGKSAKGLAIYEDLKRAGHTKAHELINFYDAHLR